MTLKARTEYRGIIKGTLCFMDQTVLHFTEVLDLKTTVDKVKYRYHFDGGVFLFDTINKTFKSKLIMIWLLGKAELVS